jgi:hypothetical protein
MRVVMGRDVRRETRMKGIEMALAVAFVLGAAGCGGGCGGASSGDASSGAPTVGGGLADGPAVVAPPLPVPPGIPAAPTLLPGERFAVTNGTDQGIVYFAWWETRDGIDNGMPGGHWHWVVAVSGAPLAPGATKVVPLFSPPVGAVDLVAVLADGTERRERVTYAPPTAAVWRVE